MPQKFTGTQKAAILLMQAGKDRAAAVLREMREAEVAEIMSEVARLHHLELSEIEEVLGEFQDIFTARSHIAQGGYSTARELLEASFGGQKADEILDNLGVTMVAAPFEFLRRADTRQVLTYLQDEHPQTIALVLAHMHPDAAAMVLSSLADELQRDVALRVAKMDRTSPEVIEQVEAILERKLSTVIQQTDFAQAGGLQTLVDILNSSDRTTERLILEGLEQEDGELADEVRNRMFVFEDIVGLDDRSIQLVLRSVDAKELAVALKGVDQKVRNKVMKNMSERAAANLAEEIQLLGPIKLKTVEEAQAGVVRAIRTLEEAGQIDMSRGGDELVV
ncbi:MAG TPA: flagellar motor switch protein FliG [Acidimicrobiia bacterium]|jgi:flagellar motor switch protein FliG|nr:flagellar motor switch protein FliG [Acidimicrobiia bacterium]